MVDTTVLDYTRGIVAMPLAESERARVSAAAALYETGLAYMRVFEELVQLANEALEAQLFEKDDRARVLEYALGVGGVVQSVQALRVDAHNV